MPYLCWAFQTSGFFAHTCTDALPAVHEPIDYSDLSISLTLWQYVGPGGNESLGSLCSLVRWGRSGKCWKFKQEQQRNGWRRDVGESEVCELLPPPYQLLLHILLHFAALSRRGESHCSFVEDSSIFGAVSSFPLAQLSGLEEGVGGETHCCW